MSIWCFGTFKRIFYAILSLAGLACIVAVFLADASAQKKDPFVRPRPVAAERDPKEVPKEGVLYVWETPSRGLQTLLVLKVIDGNSFEAAYLVPVRIRIDELKVDQAKAKSSFEELDKLVGGRLVNASLRGKNAAGEQTGDVYLGEVQKDAPNSPSGWLSEWLKGKK